MGNVEPWPKHRKPDKTKQQQQKPKTNEVL